MPLLGSLLKKGIKLRESLDQEYSSPLELQKNELRKLMIMAEQTQFGLNHRFDAILPTFRGNWDKAFYRAYQSQVPLHNYDSMYKGWWKRAQNGEANVCWPGKVKYFALSSGTSGAASKYLPITKDMVKAIQKTSIRQIMTLSKYDMPSKLFSAGILMLGGSTHLNKKGRFFEGDLSGIQAAQLPFWFQHFYKPGKKIAKTRDWEDKLNEITRQAPEWDIGIIVGVPAWIQILMEKILDYHNLDHIHQLWPNLSVYVHGGVSFDPYRKGFEKLLGRPIKYIETYLASEGFIAFQSEPDTKSMRLVLNNGIFYEFVPFDEHNFTVDGELKEEARTLMIDEVELNKEYALLMSTCSGAWRYLIGDVVRFTSIDTPEVVITGRTKHFLSLCGEHLSVDNMNKAIELVSEELNISIKEFAVSGVPYDTLFAHNWYIGTDDHVSVDILKECLDRQLKKLNDDYAVERSAALKEVFVEVLPVDCFYGWMESIGKVGGQNKFPRVLQKNQLKDWQSFLDSLQLSR